MKKLFSLIQVCGCMLLVLFLCQCVVEEEIDYISPVKERINRDYTYPLPEGFKKTGDIIIQSEVGDSFSTNIIATYINNDGIYLNETYKNSQNKKTGKFIRLNGTTSAVKFGYPSLRTDFPFLNVNTQTGEIVPVNSFAALMLPQGTDQQWQIFFDAFTRKVEEAGMVAPTPFVRPDLPDWWGPIAMINWEGVNIDKWKTIRDIVLSCYEEVIAQTAPNTEFDYRPIQERMIFDQAGSERHLFANILGIDVPAAIQRAFFAATTYTPSE